MGNTTAAKRWVLLAVVAVVASITLSLAVPRLVSSLSYLPVKSALARHWGDFPLTQAQFPALIAIANRSIEQHNEARYWQGLGWLHFLHAFSQGAGTVDLSVYAPGFLNGSGEQDLFVEGCPAAWLFLGAKKLTLGLIDNGYIGGEFLNSLSRYCISDTYYD
jgi:hypothetical protein